MIEAKGHAKVSCDICGCSVEQDYETVFNEYALRREGWQTGEYTICPECVKANAGGWRKAKLIREKGLTPSLSFRTVTESAHAVKRNWSEQCKHIRPQFYALPDKGNPDLTDGNNGMIVMYLPMPKHKNRFYQHMIDDATGWTVDPDATRYTIHQVKEQNEDGIVKISREEAYKFSQSSIDYNFSRILERKFSDNATSESVYYVLRKQTYALSVFHFYKSTTGKDAEEPYLYTGINEDSVGGVITRRSNRPFSEEENKLKQIGCKPKCRSEICNELDEIKHKWHEEYDERWKNLETWQEEYVNGLRIRFEQLCGAKGENES